MSGIYNALYQELDPKKYASDYAWSPVLQALGTAWEKHLEYLLVSQGHQVSRPSEFVSPEGIAFSPDLLINNGQFRLGEMKLTWMSPEDDLSHPKYGKWLTQMKAYCHKLETPYARLYRAHVLGKERYGPPDPQLYVEDIEFTPRELKDNWSMMMNFAQRRKLL